MSQPLLGAKPKLHARFSKLLIIPLLLGVAILLACPLDPDQEQWEIDHLPRMPAPQNVVMLDTGLDTDEVKDWWHHSPEGSDVFPVALFQALKDPESGRPLIETFGDFGFVTLSDEPGALPVGFSRVKRPNHKFVITGFNCSACHSTQIKYEDQVMHIDGGTSMLDIEKFFHATVNALHHVLNSGPETLATFIIDFVRYDHAALKLIEREAKDELAGASQGGAAAPPVNGSGTPAVDESEMDAALFAKRQSHAIPYLLQKLDTLRRITESFEQQTEAGPGRADSFGIIRNLTMVKNVVGADNFMPMTAPVSIPHLFGYGDFVHLHWDGNTTMATARNFAQAVALGADFDPYTFDSGCRPLELFEMDQVSSKLRPPAWPEEILGALDQDRVARGEKLFEQNCSSCHTEGNWVKLETIGTDPNRLLNYNVPITTGQGTSSYASQLEDFSNRLMDRSFEIHNVPEETQEEMRRTHSGVEAKWIETRDKGYRTRQLRGVWVTPPYLHNGSVPTLWDLLQPPSERPTTFQVGHRVFDPVKVGYVSDSTDPAAWTFDTAQSGNTNTGHEFGTDLSEDDKWALIEYLKTQ